MSWELQGLEELTEPFDVMAGPGPSAFTPQCFGPDEDTSDGDTDTEIFIEGRIIVYFNHSMMCYAMWLFHACSKFEVGSWKFSFLFGLGCVV